MNEPRRIDDTIVIELKQQFTDFLDRYERDQQAVRNWQIVNEKKSDEWRKTLDARIQPWEDFVKSVNMGWKIVIGFAGAVGAIYTFVAWLLRHVKWNG